MEALVLAGLESLSDRRVGACKRFMATACQTSSLKNIIPSPAAIESDYRKGSNFQDANMVIPEELMTLNLINFSECMLMVNCM